MSLVELMVAVGIVGVLATVAVPRYRAFMVQSRRGEAYTNLAHLGTLQEMYKSEHGTYYSGSAMSGTNGIGYKDGKGNTGKCNDPAGSADEGIANKLGFRPSNCKKLRYFYTFSGNTAMASAASDSSKPIYPDCQGQGSVNCGYASGDAVSMPLGSGDPTVCRNIAKYCPP